MGVIQNDLTFNDARLLRFEKEITRMRRAGHWTKEELVALFLEVLPEFEHEEKGKYLDSKM